jgi:hypothetical protein
MPTIIVECRSCSGTGLYCGFVEAKGEAVVCVSCQGTGATELSGKDFTGRKKRRGITKIRGGSGSIMDNTERATWFSYAEFESKIPEKK